MGDPRGFLTYTREVAPYADLQERVKDFEEINRLPPVEKLREQGGRCMDCGIPFCQGPDGCPLGNLIPDWNHLTYADRLEEAIEQLHATNNFPEFTGRICPAPCETACVLGINAPAVTIKQIECSVIDRAWQAGLVQAEPPAVRTDKTVAVIGSGPAGLACAQQLNRAGHLVTVFERADRIGGLLTYGIPDFKLDKALVHRRVRLMEDEGITFRTNANVGENVDPDRLRATFDAIVLCTGATQPRDLPGPGRELNGVHFAMDFLTQNNKRVAGDTFPEEEILTAEGKHVIVIGGGDTGSDCIGTSVRHGAKSITQLEILPRPADERTEEHPWPQWPFAYSTSSSQEEAAAVAGGDREFCVNTVRFEGENGALARLRCERVAWDKSGSGRPKMVPVQGGEFTLDADLVLLAMGFVHPEHPLLDRFGVDKADHGNVAVGETAMTSVEGIFAAGDCRRGQSLVVWAIAEGRDAARDVDEWLMGTTDLPRSLPR